jgi:hypothetical protein
MKLRNKLILSCAALAAVATTAVSTTFAWYTANTEVTAGTLTAETEAGSDKLLLISETGAKGTWGSKITFPASSVKFIPLSQEEDGNYYKFDQTAAAPAGNALAYDKTTEKLSGDFLAFNIYLASGGDALSVNMTKMNIVNNDKAALPKKNILSSVSGGISGGDDSGTSYTVNLLRALVVDYSTVTVTGNDGAGGFNADGLSTAAHYNLDSYTAAFGDNVGDNSNAHTYYNAVTGKTLKTKAGTASTADNLSTEALPITETQSTAGNGTWAITVPAANADATLQNYIVLHFEIFLNGWDVYCFDAVQGQDISIDFEFKVSQL